MNKPDLDFTRKLVADLQHGIADIVAALAALDPGERDAWIVMSAHGLAMTYTMDEAGKWGGVRHTTVPQAHRFSRRQADVLARHTHDGTGEPFTALHVRTALQQALTRDREMLRDIEGVLARQSQAEETPKQV